MAELSASQEPALADPPPESPETSDPAPGAEAPAAPLGDPERTRLREQYEQVAAQSGGRQIHGRAHDAHLFRRQVAVAA